MTEMLESALADTAIAAESNGKPARKAPAKPKVDAAPVSKTEQVLRKLKTAKGATVQQVMEMTGWQPHSVRGFFSGTVRKKLGLELTHEAGKDGVRRYRIIEAAA